MDNKVEEEEKPVLSIYLLFHFTQIASVTNCKVKKE